MSNAFRNYDNLLSGLNQAQAEANNVATQYHQTKASAAGNIKILGETKLFLSGKPALQKIGKNIIKPLWNEYGSTIKNKLTSAFSSGENKLPPTTPSTSTMPEFGSQAKQDMEDDAQYKDALGDMKANFEDRVASLQKEGKATSDELNTILDQGATRLRTFNKRVGSGEAEGDELVQPLQDLNNPYFNTIDDVKNFGKFTNYTQPKSSFTSDDIGAQGQDFTYNRTNGLTDEETSRIQELGAKAYNPSNITGGDSEAINNARGGVLESTNATNRNLTNEPDDWDKPFKGDPEEDVKKDLAPEVEDDAAELGGEEAATGILDAIPGLDILGAVGGAILAGIEGHHQKMETEAEKNVATATTNVDTQIGISANEALS